ncbi:MAG: metal-dependent hydrolase [bacterium TMED144]|nr:MAG: metal-dependent hydrolase [bacterium TMED144]|tara:strand:+ start:2143 stop:2904 length:762 start_codon:yes stop_codon:yes gene_type:complete
MNWIGLWTLTSREVGRFFKVYRQTVIPGLISSVLYILIFGFTLEQRISSIEGISYTIFIIPGLIMMNTLTNASSNPSSSLLQMKLTGQVPDLMQAPLSSLEISLAFIIGGVVRGVVNGILILLIGMWIGGMEVLYPIATIGFIFVVSVAFSSMGLLLGQLADTWDQLSTMQNFFLTPLSFLGGIFYSVNMLPDWAQTISAFNPIYYMINGLRFTTLGFSDSDPQYSFVIALLMSIGLSFIAIFSMKSGKKMKQ